MAALQDDAALQDNAASSPKSTRKRARVLYADTSVTRLWSEEDELALLQGMVDYGKDPRSDYEAFLNFVKHSIQAHVSVKQLRAKINKLKDKYLANVQKGDDLVFAKPHAHTLFEVSKKIWGGETKKGKEIEEASDDVEDRDEGLVGEEKKKKNQSLDFKEMYPYLSDVLLSDVDFPKAFKDIIVPKLIACQDIKDLDKEWKGVFVEDLKLYLKKLDLKAKLAKVVLDQIAP